MTPVRQTNGRSQEEQSHAVVRAGKHRLQKQGGRNGSSPGDEIMTRSRGALAHIALPSPPCRASRPSRIQRLPHSPRATAALPEAACAMVWPLVWAVRPGEDKDYENISTRSWKAIDGAGSFPLK